LKESRAFFVFTAEAQSSKEDIAGFNNPAF